MKILDINSKILLFAFLISPFTLLRFSFLGLGEVIFFAYFIYFFCKKITKSDWNFFYFTKFWIIYLTISLLGFSYNVLFLAHATGTVKGALFDFSAYLMILFTCFVLEYIIIVNKVNTYFFLKYLFIFSSVIFSSLYIISFFTPTILGLPIKYYDFFSPLAKNIHQTAMIIIVLPFLGMKIFTKEVGFFWKSFILGLIVLTLIMGLDTGSSKATLGLLLGSVMFILASLLIKFNREKKYLILIVSALLLILFLIQTDIINYLKMAFSEADPVGARAYLYKNALDTGLDSFLLGRGPGPHIEFIPGSRYFSDAHQTFLTVFLQTGVVGLLLFFSLIIKTVDKLIFHPALLAMLTPILVYALGGDILRRLPIWVLLVLLFHYLAKDEPSYIRKKLNEK